MLAFPLALLGTPARAQAPSPAPGDGAPPGSAQPQAPASPRLDIQSSAPPGEGGMAIPIPAPPSQSHLPLNLSFPATAAVSMVPGAIFALYPSLAFSEEYTDNFRLTRQDKVQNFRSTVSPGLNLLINGPRTQGTVSASLGLTQDSVNSLGELSVFANLSASVKHTFDPRLSLSLTDTFTRSDDPSLADQVGLRQERQTFTSNVLRLSADWLLGLVATQGYYQLSTFFGENDTVSHILGANAGIPLGPLMSVRAGYEFSQSHTSSETSSESTGNTTGNTGTGNTGNTTGNSTGNTVWASLSRQIGPLMTGGVSTSYALQSLDNTRIWNVSLFSTYHLPGRLSLSSSIGYSLLSADAGDVSVVTSNTSASYRFARAVISLGINQDFNQTFSQGQDFGIVLTRSYTGSFGYALTPFIDTTLRATYSENEPTGVGNSTASQNTDTFSAQASLFWRVRRWLSVGLDYTYTRYSSGAVAGEAAVENRAAVKLTSSF